METINRITGINGKVNGKRKASKRKPKLASTNNLNRTRTIITLAAGCSIPLLSLSLSYMGGQLIESSSAIAFTLLTLCCVVLAVSLSHLAWAIGDITRSPMWASWCLAIAVDATLVACELSSSLGYGSVIVNTTIFAVTMASMVLNCWAFTQHD